MKTKLTIYSYPEHYVVDGPRTRRATWLNNSLIANVDLDNLPEGVYEMTFVRQGFKLKAQFTQIEECP